jgi:hypothetical protein
MQVRKLVLEQDMLAGIAGNVACSTSSGAYAINSLMHGSEYERMLTHAEVVVRTPDDDWLGPPWAISERELPYSTLEFEKGSVASLCLQRVKATLEKLIRLKSLSCQPAAR